MAAIREFNGVKYNKGDKLHSTKTIAESYANTARTHGRPARVVKCEGGYHVYYKKVR